MLSVELRDTLTCFSLKRVADAEPGPPRRSTRRRRVEASPDYGSAYDVSPPPARPRSPVRPDLGEIVPLLQKLVKSTAAIAEGIDELNNTIHGAESHFGDCSEQVDNIVRIQKAVVYNQLAQLERAGAGRGYNVEEEKRYVQVVETLTDDFDKDIETEDRLSDEEESEVEFVASRLESRVVSASPGKESSPKAQ